ncbi:hypothetical protein GQ457_17G016030 [Hibiscus cannabinus]
MTRVRREEDKPDAIYGNDNDVLEMVSKLPRNHYVHVYLEEVLTACSDANVEPDCNVEVSDVGSFKPEINVEVSDVAGSFEPNFNVEDNDAAASFEPNFNVEDNDDAVNFEPDCNVEVSDAAIVSDDDSLEENIDEPSEIRVEPNSDSEDIDYEASKSSTHESGFTDSDDEAFDDVSDVHPGVGDKVKVEIDDDSGHSDSLYSVGESDSDGPCRKQRFPEFNTTVDISDPNFKVGLLFATKQVLREAVKMYSIKNRYNVRLKRNDSRKIQAVCKAGCPWVLWASPVDLKEPCGTWQIKSLVVEHRWQKNLALEMLHGNVKEQYGKLYDYLAFDSDAEAFDDVSDVHAGVGDKVKVEIDDDSVHSDSLYSVDESDSDGPCRKQRFPEFNTTVDISNPNFKVGLLFATKQVLREAVKMYSIKNRYSVRLKRNDSRKIQPVCKAGCPWVLWASPVVLKEPCGTWQIKSLVAEHRCLKEYKNPNITSKFMAKQYLDAFNIDPNYSAKSLKQAVFKDYSIHVHLSKCCRAKELGP